MGALRFFLGRANAGKTRAMYEAIRAHMAKGERAVLIVPEQFTFEAEKQLSALCGGLLGAEVLSMERLSERVLDKSGRALPYLSGQGLAMVVRRALAENAETLTAFSRAAAHSGFAADLAALFSEFKRAQITPDMLAAAQNKLPAGTLLSEKLQDAALLYAETDGYLAGRYLTLDDAGNAVVSLLPDSFIAGAYLYFDGFPAATGQTYAILSALMDAAALLTVSLTLPAEDAPDAEVFLPNRMAYDTLRRMAEQKGLPVQVERFSETGGGVAPALSHLEQNLFLASPAVYREKTHAVTVYGATDRNAEAAAVADAVLGAARQGARYRDMAVVTSDMAAYGPALFRSFRLRGIPVFYDEKRPLSGHAAAELVEAALSCVAEGFLPRDVMRLLKCGYAGVGRDDAELFENYCLRYGVRGSGFLKPFLLGADAAAAERAREALMGPLVRLREALRGRTVGEKLTALYAYLTELNLSDQLTARAASLENAGRVALAEEHAQVWRALTALFDQLYAILGPQPMKRSDFLAVLREGLSADAIGVIPDTADRVLLGDVHRTRLPRVKRLFIMGVNDGLLPRSRTDDGLIDGDELALLSRAGLPVWNGADYGTALDRQGLYETLCCASERVFFSFSYAAAESELAPSALIAAIEEIFPQAVRAGDLMHQDALPASERAGVSLLARELGKAGPGDERSPLCRALLSYYLSRPDTRARGAALEAISAGRVSPAPFSRALADRLYGDRPQMSASRLETYNACPFRHLMSYGLGAEARREGGERAADLGAFYHAALDAFLRRCEMERVNWKGLSEQEIDALLDAVLPEVVALHNDGIFLNNARLRATLFLLVATIRESAHALVRQIAAGAFTPLGTELRFGPGCAFPAILLTMPDGKSALLSGVIDRVDAAPGPDNTRLLRVIDYKTGGRAIDFSAVLAGLTLQLPLYLAAVAGGPDIGEPMGPATDGGNEAANIKAAAAANDVAAGLYYMPVRVAPPQDGEDVMKTLRAQFRLRGLTLSEPAVLECAEDAMAGASEVMQGVRRNKNGGYAGALVNEVEMTGLLFAARRIASRTAGGMLAGGAAVSPAEGACKFCEYKSVCRFDVGLPACRVRKRQRVARDEFFRLIGEERP